VSIYREQLMEVVREWTKEQIDNYINRLEARVKETTQLIRDLRDIKKKMSKSTPDNGDRGGK
jgi:hypothetical protein